MLYNDAKQAIFARGTVPDGFGPRRSVGFAFDPKSGKTLVVYGRVADGPAGYFTAPIPPAMDQQEAQWLLTHHPAVNAYTVVID